MKLKENNWYKVTIYDNRIAKDKVLMIADTRRLYEVTYRNGKKELIKILGQELRGIECVNILNDYEKFICDLELWKENRVKETDYILSKYTNDIVEED